LNLFFEVLTIGLILSIDSFSAAIAMGLKPFTKKDAIKFAISSGGAEALSTLFGAFAGTYIVQHFSSIDHWVAFFLLGGIALHMAYEGIQTFRNPPPPDATLTFHSFAKVLVVSFATSLDAFGVGVSLGISSKPIIGFIISIGLWAFISTLVGLYFSKKLSTKFGPIMHFVGAAVLAIMAVKMLDI